MTWMARLLLLVAPLLPTPSTAAAQELAAIPSLRSRVTDLTATLDASQASALESKLAALEDETGTQIAVLIVPTVRPETIEQYALRVAESWRLGREDVDDGALLIVALEDREVRIEVGYGLEGALTDATSNRIIDEAIVPHFRAGDMYGGVAAGVDRMIAVARGEELPPAERGPVEGPGGLMPFLFVAFFVVMAVGGILRAILGRVLGATATGTLTGAVVFLMSSLLGVAALAGLGAFLFALMSGGRRGWSSRGRSGPGSRGGWGGGGWLGGGGGFGGGGLGGGGFGGFSGGGGGFGGGGASGRW